MWLFLRGAKEEGKNQRAKKRIIFWSASTFIVASSFQIDLFQFESDPTAETQERSETTNLVCTNHEERKKKQDAKKKKKERGRNEERKKV